MLVEKDEGSLLLPNAHELVGTLENILWLLLGRGRHFEIYGLWRATSRRGSKKLRRFADAGGRCRWADSLCGISQIYQE